MLKNLINYEKIQILKYNKNERITNQKRESQKDRDKYLTQFMIIYENSDNYIVIKLEYQLKVLILIFYYFFYYKK